MRIVLDTNVLISALITRDTPPDSLCQAWSRGEFDLVTSLAQLDELSLVLARPRVQKYIDPTDAATLVENYAQELFKTEELKGYLKNTLKTQKSVYQHVIYDSAGVERKFAEELEANEAVKVYAKLPGWFKIPTPLGTYNPDWAVLVEVDGVEKLYFVVETKGSNWWDDLRHKEGAKIKCGEKHFEALAVDENSAKYIKHRFSRGV